MVQVLIYYPYFDGTSTSLIDTYLNLKRYNIDVECFVAIDQKEIKRNLEYIQTLNKSVPKEFSYKTISLDEAWNKQYDNLIMSFGVFRFLNDMPIRYNRLFILDAGRIVSDCFLNNSKFINYVKSMKNVIVYGNKANAELFKFKDYKIWYHKFSRERFQLLKTLPLKKQIVTSNDREKHGNMSFDNLSCNELNFHRYKKDEGIYRENIGKMIFEFSALGKKVFYNPKNKFCDDGLTEYLALFGIDDTQKQQINITEEQLFDILGMHKDDILLNDIKRYEK